MALQKVLAYISGKFTELVGVDTSSGAGDAGKIVHLGSSGRLSTTMMPEGIGADTVSLVASEGLAAGAWINIWNDSGTPTMRNADASGADQAKAVDGFVLEAVTSGATGIAYKEGNNTQVSGMTPGSDVFMSATPGAGTHTAPTTAGHTVQRIGKATSATSVDFERGIPVTLV